MTGYSIAFAILAPAPGAALAQDMPGAVDLGAQARTQVQSSMADGYAERGGVRARGPNGAALTARSKAYCDSYPARARRYGSADPRVVKLAAACRRAGYDY